MKSIINTLIVLIFLTPAVQSQDSIDILGSVLDSAGFTRTDLGYHPRGYWNRFPLDTPYRLSSFDDLFAEPLKLIDYTKTMAYAVDRYLDPSFADTNSYALYYLTYALGVDRKLGGFRNYSPNLIQAGDSPFALQEAVGAFFRDSADYPARRETDSLSGLIPDDTRRILARALLNLADIIHWRDLAFRNCGRATMQKAFEIRDLASTQADGTVYHPEIDDLARDIDYPSLHYAALKASALAKETADSLLTSGGIPDDLMFDIAAPGGRIVLLGEKSLSPTGKAFDCSNSLLVVDFGNSGVFEGAIGAGSSLDNPVSIFIDLGGDDYYRSDSGTASGGAGLMGIGVMYDASGNDRYDMADYSLGCGFFGAGILYDREGDDDYRSRLSGQGCGYFGIGLCFDGTGNDTYFIYGDGQGYGGIGGGVGVLADFQGDDFYKAEPYAENFDRADYHSDYEINGNSVQGVGFGRRGDMTDGHAWAGGLGAIIDIYGNDHYLSGNWSLGCAYWFATGIAYDGHGDDIYESCYFTQGSGAHYCNAILLDEGGNDTHELFATAGAALGFGWDFTNAFLINCGGDDSYLAKKISMGLAEIRSNAFLLDIGGNDRYRLGQGTLGLGAVDYRRDYKIPSRMSPYYTYAKSFGCFLDIGGDDVYESFAGDSSQVHNKAANDRIWFTPTRGDSTSGINNIGVGLDTEQGVIPELEKWNQD